jgi:hypothetical protein
MVLPALLMGDRYASVRGRYVPTVPIGPVSVRARPSPPKGEDGVPIPA